MIAAHRWDWWVRVGWRTARLSEVTALRHLDHLATAFRRNSPGVRVALGFHRLPMPHAHGVVRFSRRLRARLTSADAVRDWLASLWVHGPAWVEPFDDARLDREHPRGRGAARYLVADPGAVVTTNLDLGGR